MSNFHPDFPRLCQRKLLYVFPFSRWRYLRTLRRPLFLLWRLWLRSAAINIRALRLWRLILRCLLIVVIQCLLLWLRLLSFRRALLRLRLLLPFWLLSFALLLRLLGTALL